MRWTGRRREIARGLNRFIIETHEVHGTVRFLLFLEISKYGLFSTSHTLAL